MSFLAGIYAETPLNTSEISQADLDIVNKSRSNPLRWNGQFSPQLVQVLLNTYATSGSVLFDPFLGSGTVLLEAGLASLSASGTEINPAAVTLAQTYGFINVPVELRRFHLKEIDRLLQREFLQALPLFQNPDQNPSRQDPGAIKSRLVGLLLEVEERLQIRLLETLIVLLDFYQPNLSADKVLTVWKKLTGLVLELPFSQQPIEVFHADARKTPLPDSSVDLVLTSPPYINVFNYHQQYRASMEALSWNLLRVAKSEIGSNRKHRGNRFFLTVIQFCLDIAQTFSEMVRVCRSDGRLIFIVGRESAVRGTPFYNGEIVAEVAHRALGFDLILKQERVFLNRFGQSIFEDILHFSPPAGDPGGGVEPARKVAQDVLEAAYLVASDEAKEGMKLALTNIDQVRPSPIFDLSKVCQTSKGARDAGFTYSSRG